MVPNKPQPKNKSKKTNPVKLRLSEIHTLKGLLEDFKISKWDYVLIGDGSGSKWDYEGAWGCWMFERAKRDKPQPFFGSSNVATVSVCEMMAYVMPLLWLKANRKIRPADVHIFTDSEYLVNVGSCRGARKANAELWHMFDQYTRVGLKLHWHWIPRDTINPNKFADAIAGEMRLAVKNRDFVTPALDGLGKTLADIFPWTNDDEEVT